MDIRKCTADAIGSFWLTFAGNGSAVIAAASLQFGIGLPGVSLGFGLTVQDVLKCVWSALGGYPARPITTQPCGTAAPGTSRKYVELL